MTTTVGSLDIPGTPALTTPHCVAKHAVAQLLQAQRPLRRILNPTARKGTYAAIAAALAPEADIETAEPDRDDARLLRRAGYRAFHGTLQEYVIAHLSAPRFDGIVGALPARNWRNDVELAGALLHPGGRLVAVLPGPVAAMAGSQFQAALSRARTEWQECPAWMVEASGMTGRWTWLIADMPASGML